MRHLAQGPGCRKNVRIRIRKRISSREGLESGL